VPIDLRPSLQPQSKRRPSLADAPAPVPTAASFMDPRTRTANRDKFGDSAPQHPSHRRLAITQQMPPAFLTVTDVFVSVKMCEASPHFACGASPERPRAGESIVELNHHTHDGLRNQ
jgi:hypothetical protein